MGIKWKGNMIRTYGCMEKKRKGKDKWKERQVIQSVRKRRDMPSCNLHGKEPCLAFDFTTFSFSRNSISLSMVTRYDLTRYLW